MKNEIKWKEEGRDISTKVDYYDYKSESDFYNGITKILDEGIKKYEEKNIPVEINISHIPSCVLEDLFDLEVTDFNGWQCDWWSDFMYKGQKIYVMGGAWYVTATLTIGEG